MMDKMDAKPVFTIIVPVYNEQEVVEVTHGRLTEVFKSVGEPYEILYVNDGSRDRTIDILHEICGRDENARALNFSRNFGHMAAITAGMDHARGDAVIVIDADLQDPPEILPEMIKEWRNGYDVVYGKRISRKGETWFKKLTARVYYRLLHNLTNVDIPVDTGEFRLIDRKVCDAMKSLPERNRYIRGLVSWVGFRQKAVEYVREERFAGETKYPLKKMIKLAADGIASFSYKPLKLAMGIGAILSVCGFIYLIVILIRHIVNSASMITGWASTTAIILFSQGIVLMMLGIIGEYIGRIFDELKGRPIYIVRDEYGKDISNDKQ